MLVTKALESMHASLAVAEYFAKSAENTKKQLEAICVIPKVDFITKNSSKNIKINSPSFNAPTNLQNFINASQTSQKLLSDYEPENFSKTQLNIDLPSKTQKEPPPVNLIIFNITEPSPEKEEVINKCNPQSSNPPKTKKSEQKLKDMISAINELIITAQKHNIFIDKNKMPTPKKEFIIILKKLYPQIFNTSPSTIAENYLSGTEFKFQNGVKGNKCEDLKRLQALFG
ncbi:TPA: hypothetical protein I8Z78_000370 [Legionella pneumophila]|nr:hypothetical protein [Legionella pneumophila]